MMTQHLTEAPAIPVIYRSARARRATYHDPVRRREFCPNT
jgi:hypothetical protein